MAHFFFDFVTIFHQYLTTLTQRFLNLKKCANIEKFEELDSN
jgi:hypothetical protein